MTELLTAKLNRPRLAGAMIERPRLYAQLDRWCAVRAVVIHAPAGFGKSSLVNRWLETAGLVARTAWLNLDEDDADPARFVEAVAATLEPLYPGVLAQVRPMLADMQGGPARAWRRLLGAIQAGSAKAPAADASEDGAASSHDDVLLVLDDLHRAQSDAVDELLLTLLESGPPSLHLVLLTRRRGSLRLARFHAHGELITLAADDLRFTDDEVADFLAAKGFATATDQELATVTARSEGWVTALQLATLSLRRPGDMRALLDALHGDRDWLSEFLAGEVLERQPPALKRFLLETSILDEFTEALCVAVTGDAGAYAHLTALTHADLFLIGLDDRAGWFRYHHLFQELLQHRLRSQVEPAHIVRLHRAAARWLAGAGRVEAAVRHSLAAGDEAAAADLVETHQSTGLLHDLHRAKRLFDLLPDSVTSTRVHLLLNRAFVAMVAAEKGFETFVELAGAAVARQTPPTTTTELLRGDWSIMQGAVAYLHGNHKAAARRLAEAEPYVPSAPAHIAGTYWFLQMHLNHLAGDYATALRCSDHALAAFARVEFHLGVVAIQRELARWSMLRGDSAEARGRTRALFDSWQQQGLYPIRDLIETYVIAAEDAYLCNELEPALEYLQRAQAAAQQMQDDELVLVTTLMMLECEAIMKGNAGKVPAQIEAFQQLVTTTFPVQLLDIETRRLVRTHQGHACWPLVEYVGLDFPNTVEEYAKYALIPFVRAYVARGRDLAEINTLLDEATAYCAAKDMRLRQLQLLAFTAWQQLQLHGPSHAIGSLTQACDLARATGYVRVLLDIPALGPLLAKDGTSLAPGVGMVAPEESALGLSLSEQRILGLLAADLTYRAIAQELGISINTVRFHIRNLYGKLSTHRRTSAVMRARELGILTPDRKE